MDRNDRMDDDLPRDDVRARASGSTGDHADRDRRVPDDLRRDDTTGDEVGEAVGGISGVLTGAALGSLGGPIGTIIGGIAGAVSGWWAGRAISEAARHVTDEDEAFYREHYQRANAGLADRSYDDVRPAYQLGHLAGRNPDYAGRSFDDVEPDLQRGWTGDVASQYGEWKIVRPFAREAYERGRTSASGVAGSTPATRDASASSGLADAAPRSAALAGGTETGLGTGGAGMMGAGVSDAARGASRSTERIDDTTDRIAMHGRDASDRQDARGLADRMEDRLDDARDRVDGNPASRPGIDRTDDVDRRI